MKYFDAYFPHEASSSMDSKIIKLIEEVGMKGYGAYWIIMEFLRVQKHYTGELDALSHLARKAKTTKKFLLRVVCNYGLFVVNEGVFYSPTLNGMMQPLREKRRGLKEKREGLPPYATSDVPKADVPREEQRLPLKESKGAIEGQPLTQEPNSEYKGVKREEIKGCKKGEATPKGDTHRVKKQPLKSDFWSSYTPPQWALDRKSHNYEGMMNVLKELKIAERDQIETIMVMANYGRIGNPFWKILYKKPIHEWRRLKEPGKSIIRSLKKYGDSS